VSVVSNGIVSVDLEARSGPRERKGEVDKRRGQEETGKGGGERQEGKGEERERKDVGKADNERRTYQQLPTAVLATFAEGRN
jgi:hypothetical protein